MTPVNSTDSDETFIQRSIQTPWFYVAVVEALILVFIGGMAFQSYRFSLLNPVQNSQKNKQVANTAGSDSQQKPTDESAQKPLQTSLPTWLSEVEQHPEDKAIGDPDAPVTITEYTDFQCPFCRRHSSRTFPKIVQEYVKTGKVYYKIRHFPLARAHPQAIPTAVASECAAEQGKFWEFKELAMQNQDQLSRQNLIKFGEVLKLSDMGSYKSCLQDRNRVQTIKSEYKQGRSQEIKGTPGILIEDELVEGALPFNQFKPKIEQALSNQAG